MLFCRCLKSNCKGEDIFQKINEFLTVADLQWRNCIGICAMMGKRSGFVTKVKEHTNKQIVSTHCRIHRKALAAKQMSPELDIVLRNVVKIINYSLPSLS